MARIGGGNGGTCGDRNQRCGRVGWRDTCGLACGPTACREQCTAGSPTLDAGQNGGSTYQAETVGCQGWHQVDEDAHRVRSSQWRDKKRRAHGGGEKGALCGGRMTGSPPHQTNGDAEGRPFQPHGKRLRAHCRAIRRARMVGGSERIWWRISRGRAGGWAEWGDQPGAGAEWQPEGHQQSRIISQKLISTDLAEDTATNGRVVVATAQTGCVEIASVEVGRGGGRSNAKEATS